MGKKRFRLYCMLSKRTTLQAGGGDKINEINLLKRLSSFADVYYNDDLFDLNLPDYGLRGGEVRMPSRAYDMYYVRNNPSLFKRLPSPKLYAAQPYDEEIFTIADAVTTRSFAWQKALERFNFDAKARQMLSGLFYPAECITAPKRVLSFRQAIEDNFSEIDTSSLLLFKYRARFTLAKFTVGYFGRIEAITFPWTYYHSLPDLSREIAGLRTVFAGKLKLQGLPADFADWAHLCRSYISHAEMPYALSACDVLLANEQKEARWAASMKTLEAMACGVPILAPNFESYREHLGEKYPLFYDSERELTEKTLNLYTDLGFRAEIREYLLRRAENFREKHLNTELEKVVTGFLKNFYEK